MRGNLVAIKEGRVESIEKLAKFHLRRYIDRIKNLRLDYGPSHMTEQRVSLEVAELINNTFFQYNSEEVKHAYRLLFKS